MDDDEETIRELFDACDVDENGTISLEELIDVFGFLGKDLEQDEVSLLGEKFGLDSPSAELDFPAFSKGIHAFMFGDVDEEFEKMSRQSRSSSVLHTPTSATDASDLMSLDIGDVLDDQDDDDDVMDPAEERRREEMLLNRRKSSASRRISINRRRSSAMTLDAVRRATLSGNPHEALEELLMEEAETLFAIYDADGDGEITFDELIEAMVELGGEADEEKLRELMKELDTNNDGVIGFEEFKSGMIHYIAGSGLGAILGGSLGALAEEDKELQQASDSVSQAKDGFVAPILNLQQELVGLFCLCDRDRNGTLSVDELPTLFDALGDGISASVVTWFKNEEAHGHTFTQAQFVATMTKFVEKEKSVSAERLREIPFQMGNAKDLTTEQKSEIDHIFLMLDLDCSGLISSNELTTMLDVDQQQLEELISELDRDGSGDINYYEFVDGLAGFYVKNELPSVLSLLNHKGVDRLEMSLSEEGMAELRSQLAKQQHEVAALATKSETLQEKLQEKEKQYNDLLEQLLAMQNNQEDATDQEKADMMSMQGVINNLKSELTSGRSELEERDNRVRELEERLKQTEQQAEERLMQQAEELAQRVNTLMETNDRLVQEKNLEIEAAEEERAEKLAQKVLITMRKQKVETLEKNVQEQEAQAEELKKAKSLLESQVDTMKKKLQGESSEKETLQQKLAEAEQERLEMERAKKELEDKLNSMKSNLNQETRRMTLSMNSSMQSQLQESIAAMQRDQDVQENYLCFIDRPLNYQEIKLLSNKHLKHMCKILGVSRKGTHEELVERLHENELMLGTVPNNILVSLLIKQGETPLEQRILMLVQLSPNPDGPKTLEQLIEELGDADSDSDDEAQDMEQSGDIDDDQENNNSSTSTGKSEKRKTINVERTTTLERVKASEESHRVIKDAIQREMQEMEEGTVSPVMASSSSSNDGSKPESFRMRNLSEINEEKSKVKDMAVEVDVQVEGGGVGSSSSSSSSGSATDKGQSLDLQLGTESFEGLALDIIDTVTYKDIKNPYTLYCIHVNHDGNMWEVFRDYAVFQDLHKSLKKRFPVDMKHVPLPKYATGWFATEPDPEEIPQRQKELDDYLQDLVSHPFIQFSETLHQFLQPWYRPPASMIENPVLRGFLTKEGHVFSSWRKRFMVLTKDRLYYYLDENSSQPKGSIVLLKGSISLKEYKGKPNSFVVTEAGGTSYPMFAEDHQEMQLWTTTIGDVMSELNRKSMSISSKKK